MTKKKIEKKHTEGEEKILDEILNMMIHKTRLTVRQIFFNPTPKQAKEFWCTNCDGFHNIKKCPDLKKKNLST